jgi:hypothetical protein
MVRRNSSVMQDISIGFHRCTIHKSSEIELTRRETVLLSILQMLSDELVVPELNYVNARPSRIISLDEDSIRAYLQEIDDLNADEKWTACMFSCRTGSGHFHVCISKIDGLEWIEEEIQFSFPNKTNLEKIPNVFSKVCVLFNANFGYTFNFLLAGLHGRAWRGYEQALRKHPIEEHQFFLPPELPIGVEDTLPSLLLGSEFDRLKVPNGIYWLNYWNPVQIENLGRDRVLSAGWEQIIPHENGALTLVTTREPTSVLNSDHLQKIGAIVNHLDLCQVQQRFQY